MELHTHVSEYTTIYDYLWLLKKPTLFHQIEKIERAHLKFFSHNLKIFLSRNF